MDESITNRDEELIMYTIAKGIHTHTSVYSQYIQIILHSQVFSVNTRTTESERKKECAFVVSSSSIDELELVFLEMSNELNRTTTFNLFEELDLVRKIS